MSHVRLDYIPVVSKSVINDHAIVFMNIQFVAENFNFNFFFHVSNNSSAPAVDISISTTDESVVQHDEAFDESISAAISSSPKSFGSICSSLDSTFQL